MKIFNAAFWLMSISLTAQAAPTDACPKYTNEKFTLVELTKIIRTESCQVKTIDDVLGLLPERMRSRMSLFYKSKSLQGPHKVDYVNPRAILSSVEDRFALPSPAMMLSFNGDPSQRGYDRLEVLNLNPLARDGNVFNYHEIDFPEEKTVRSLSWSKAQAKIRISAANPAKCVQCHGQPARPIFQQYPTWEGAFGARHTHALSPEDAAGLNEFIKAHSDSHTSRYRHLNPKRMKDKDPSGVINSNVGLQDPLPFHGAVQTLQMNTDLSNYNGVRVAGLLRKLDFYEAFKFAIDGGLRECRSPTSFFTQPVLEKLIKNIDQKYNFSSASAQKEAQDKFLQIAAGIKEGSTGSFSTILGPDMDYSTSPKERLKIHRQYWNNSAVLFALAVDTMTKQGVERYVPETAMLRLILEGQGVSMNNWWADLKQPTYRSNSGIGQPWSVFLKAQDPSVALSESEVPADRQIPYNNDFLCEKLANKSRSALAQFVVREFPAPAPLPPSMDGYPAVFQNTCAKCHVENEVGPYIPFDSAAKMATWFKSGGSAKRIYYKVFEAPELSSMPPNRDLTVEEKNQVNRYLQQFR